MQILLLILAGSLLLYRGLGAAGVEALASWPAATRWALATLLLVTASAHFNRMKDGLVRMVPGWVPNPLLTIYLTGVCEILGAIGILVPATRRYAGLALILFLVAIFPANVKAAREGLRVAGRPAPPLWQRLPMQLLLIGLLWWSTLYAGGGAGAGRVTSSRWQRWAQGVGAAGRPSRSPSRPRAWGILSRDAAVAQVERAGVS